MSKDDDELRLGLTFRSFVPLEIEHRGDGILEMSVAFDETHLNRAGMVHGGFISAALDVAIAGGAVAVASQSREFFGITLSMNINFLQPLGPGRALCKSQVIGGGTKSKIVQATLETCSDDGVNQCHASATGTVKVIRLEDDLEQR
ncbi:MAG: PaaI family thioesterase [Chromatiales bacterium]|jgi:uncharacterized protein (TIGR00369 family)|nr:PaaI family thioesterase [Chromatiales bacterium]